METKTSKPSASVEERKQRQAQALRANLARRKAQGRARADQDGDEAAAGGDDLAPEVAERS